MQKYNYTLTGIATNSSLGENTERHEEELGVRSVRRRTAQ